MVHVAGADQLRSNTGVAVLRAGRQGSQQRAGAGGSMWSVLVFGILTAIFTWVWFGGRGKRKEADAGVQQQQQQDGGAEEPAAAGKAPESTSEQSGAGTEESGRVTSGESRITEPLATAPVQEVLSRCVPETSEDEALRAGSSVQAHGKPGSPALGEAAAQPEGGVYGETLTHAEEGCPAGVPHTYVRDRQSSGTYGVQSNEESIQVPDRDLIQSNEESIQVPDRDLIQSNEESIQVPDRDLIQSNEESIQVPDRDLIQSNEESIQVPDRDLIQSNEESIQVPDRDLIQSNEESIQVPDRDLIQSNEESIQVPDRDLIQSNEESIQVPDRDLIQSNEESIQVPDRDLIQSNEESIQVPDRDLIQSNEESIQVPDRDLIQSNEESIQVPDRDLIQSNEESIQVPDRDLIQSNEESIQVPDRDLIQSNEESIQVPDRDLIQSNEESIQVPDRDLIQSSEESIQVPDRDLIQSNEESIPVPDVQDKDVIQSSVGDMQFPDVPEKDEVQSKLEAMHPPGVLERDVQTILGDFPTGFSDAEQLRCNVEVMSSPDVPERVGLQITDELHPAGILTEASVQASSNLVHPIELHEEDSVYPENVQQKEAVEDSPTDISEREWVQSNGEEPFHATGSVQETVPPITTQKVVHVNGVEEIPVNAEENASASGLLGETSAAFTDQQNSETILDSTQESNIKDTDSFDHDSAPVKDIMESHDHSKQQTDFVKHEYLEKLTDMALDKHSLTDHGDTIEPIVGLQDNTDVASNIISNDPTYKGSTATHISEELTLQGAQSSPVLDTSTMLPLFHQDEEESPGLKGSALGEEACFSNNSDTPFHEDNHLKAKRVAAIQPMQQNVSIGFKVHYITHSDSQIIAVTGDRKELGEWESFVPLTYVKDGIWSNSVTLPVDSSVEWKFVMVENGKIKRWEECPNRRSKAAHDDFETQQWWGHP